MIVISSAVVLVSPTEGINADSPVFGYVNLVTVSNVVAGTTASGYPASNVANPATFLEWRGADTTEQLFTVNLAGNTEDVDYVGIARHNFGSAQIAVSIEGDTGSGYTVVGAEVLPGDDTPLLFRIATASYIGLRVRMKSGGSAPRIAVVYAGKLLVCQRRFYVGHAPITLNRQSRITNGRSESGNFLGRIVLGEGVSTSVNLQNLDPAWYRANFDPFVKASKDCPFFFAWRPSTYPAEVGYCWATNEPKVTNQRANGMMQVDLQLAGIRA